MTDSFLLAVTLFVFFVYGVRAVIALMYWISDPTEPSWNSAWRRAGRRSL